MSKFQKILSIVFIALLALLVYAEATKKPPISWFPSYSKLDKIPLGTYVFHDLFSEKRGDHFIETETPPYEVLKDTTIKGTYFFLNNSVNFDKTELEDLLDWTSKGNHLFIAAASISENLSDTLSLQTSNAYLFDSMNSEPMLNFTNKKLKSVEAYRLNKEFPVTYFEKIDTLKQTALGLTQIFNDTLKITEPNINFLEAPFGAGKIFIHLQPEIFSNYVLLSEKNKVLAEKTLSYIPKDHTLIWDNYYKTGKKINISPLRALLNNRYLKWAYYLALIGIAIYVLFEGKRKQRSIPIVKPLTNKTFEYTQTISGMYLDKNEHHKIALKQMNLFMEFIRTRLRLPTEKVDNRFLKAVAARSGNTLENTKSIFTLIEKIQHQNPQLTTQEQLEELYKTITHFKQQTDGKH
ncbi:hypothetical protein SCB49_14050 [unidentified eubacterium SCB49]|nr:hypothetical protein SCB49_14050 [unidentified eubacterium SCB49]